MRPDSEPAPSSPANRPDLEEFLSALDGFLDKQATPHDPGYVRFLEIFCRSVGSAEGHLLRSGDGGSLVSVGGVGVRPEFEKEFNDAHARHSAEPCPLDHALKQKDVIAIVELKKGPDVPAWFMDVMNHQGFKSMVAVPLMGQTKVAGLLCAYYHDICLFDRGTKDQLLVMGRMIGAATENSKTAPGAAANVSSNAALDELLTRLVVEAPPKLQAYGILTAVLKGALPAAGLACGAVRRSDAGLTMTVADGVNIPLSSISARYTVPLFLQRRLIAGAKIPPSVKFSDWAEFRPLLDGAVFKVIAHPIQWNGELIGAIVAWRTDGPAFAAADEVLLERLAKIMALILRP